MMSRRWLIATLITGGLLVGGGLVFGQVRSPDFPDISGHPQVLDIRWAASRGWILGYPDGAFRPDQTITPRQIATVIGRAFPEGMTRADLTSLLRARDPARFKQGEWEVRDERWEEARQGRPCAPYVLTDCGVFEYHRLVSVAEAHRSGGWRWSVVTKEAYYLDEENIYRFARNENSARGDDLVSDRWQPTEEAACDYANRWRTIKEKWGLMIDSEEERQLTWLCDPDYSPIRWRPVTTTTTIVPQQHVGNVPSIVPNLGSGWIFPQQPVGSVPSVRLVETRTEDGGYVYRLEVPPVLGGSVVGWVEWCADLPDQARADGCGNPTRTPLEVLTFGGQTLAGTVPADGLIYTLSPITGVECLTNCRIDILRETEERSG